MGVMSPRAALRHHTLGLTFGRRGSPSRTAEAASGTFARGKRFDDMHGAYDEVDVLAGEIVANLVASTVETARLYRYVPKDEPRANPNGTMRMAPPLTS